MIVVTGGSLGEREGIMIRKARVAGTFYQGSRDKLQRQIEDCYTHRLGPGNVPELSQVREGNILGIISPHAGYMYSGPIAAWSFRELVQSQIPDTVVILGPNHRGFGSPIALMGEGEWETPLGCISINEELSSKLIRDSTGLVELNTEAHEWEHSLEVQLPFLQYSYGNDFRIVPICMMDQSESVSSRLGEILYSLIEGENIVVIASSDLTHYQPHQVAEKEDKLILKAILSLDYRELGKIIRRGNFSLCGPGPVMTLMSVVTHLGAKKIKLLQYATSGDITGDYRAVVGYASLLIEK